MIAGLAGPSAAPAPEAAGGGETVAPADPPAPPPPAAKPEEPADDHRPRQRDEPGDGNGAGDGNGDVTPPTGPVRVVLAGPQGPVAPGALVNVRVLVENADGVASVPFHLHFDPRVVSFEQALQGAFMSSDGNPAVVMAASLSSGDVVVVGASRLGAVPGISGSGEICTLQFRAVAPGGTTFGFAEASVRGPSGANIPASFVATSVVVP
jgi:general secretion pathway protein D